MWTTLTALEALGQQHRTDWRSHSRKVFDNGNTYACEMTNTAVFTLDRPVRTDRIEVWYQWHSHERSLKYKLSKDGHALLSGVMTKGNCDPYQTEWCVAADGLDLLLRPGTYLIQTEHPHICQNAASDGNGIVKVFGVLR
jgi:hypothetical protein